MVKNFNQQYARQTSMTLRFFARMLVLGSTCDSSGQPQSPSRGLRVFRNAHPAFARGELLFLPQRHSSKKIQRGGLLLDTRDGLLTGGDTGPAVVPGDPEKSLLIKAVRYLDKDLQMPPKDKRLSESQIADLVMWVKMGAPDSALRTGGCNRRRTFNPAALRFCRRPQTLGLSNPAQANHPRRDQPALDAIAHRQLHPRATGGKTSFPRADGRQTHLDSPRHL